MKRHTRRSTWMGIVTVVSLTTSLWAQSATRPASTTQPALSAAPGKALPAGNAHVGVIRGTDVIIRSGFSTNYYPVIKLNRGDKVTIQGEQYGWLEILSPPGTFGLVEKTFIDRIDDKSGAANGTVQVFAGSTMDNRRYAKQVKLAKGDRVDILGETDDGAFFKIAPPPGAHLWVRADLVDRGEGSAIVPGPLPPNIEKVRPGDLDANKGPKTGTGSPTVGKTAAKPTPAAPAKDIEKYQLQINAIEAEITAENAKPLSERQFGTIIEKLQPVAEQSDDEVSQIYAKTRIEQLRDHMSLAAAVKEVRDLRENTFATSDQMRIARGNIKAGAAKPMDEVAVRGEIRVSSIYAGEGGLPKRWRIVEPPTGKTIGYIELPEGSPVDPVQYYGKYVGIKALSQRQSQGTIPPVPIFTVQEIRVLDPASQSKGSDDAGVSASDKPPTVAAPASQPTPSSTPPASTQPSAEAGK